MKNILIIAVTLLLFITPSFADVKKPIKRAENILAVLDLESVGKVDKDVVRPLTESIRREIVRSDKYEVMDRGNMGKILKEQAFQMSGCTSRECAVEAGQLLGVGKIVVGSISIVGKTYLLSLSLVNIETGKVELVEDQECKCEVDDLIQLSKKVAGKLMGVIVADSTEVTSSAEPVRNVSTAPPRERFVDNNDGTILDRSTGLMWQKADDGETRTKAKSIAYCNELRLAGSQDWLLPTFEQLKTLIDKSRQNPAINTKYFPDTKYGSGFFSRVGYRSSTPTPWAKSAPEPVYGVDFGNGEEDSYERLNSQYVRCVRRGQ